MGTRSTETLDMKFFVVIALAGAAVASPSNRNDDDGAAAALECTAGTNIGDKLANAFSSCFGSRAGMRKEVKRIQLARNDEQCYSYDEIMQWVEEEYAGKYFKIFSNYFNFKLSETNFSLSFNVLQL